MKKGSLVVNRLSTAILALIGCGLVAGATPAAATEVSIASGRPGSVYYPVGGALCTLVNEHTAQHDITCTVEFGVGSVANIRTMADGEATMAMTQSDVQRDAVTGTGAFATAEPMTDLRAIAALFVEQVTIATRKDKGIASFDDLKGRRVYLGTPGSGTRVIMDRLMEAEGWSPEDVVDVPMTALQAPNLAEALCDSEIDAFVLTTGHPSPQVREATSMCDVVLVPLTGPVVEDLIAREKLYVASTVPAGLYKGVNKDVPGIGLVATLVTTAEVPDDTVYEITKAFVEGYDRLRESSPLFSSLTADQLSEDGLTAPLHDGAARYYSEIGQQ